MKTALERFNSKFRVLPSGCWEWTGARVPGGYGHMRFRGRNHNAHRVSYILHCGEIVGRKDIHHRCSNKWCVNPTHLEALTRLAHQIATPKSARNRTHCPQGHELIDGNLVASRLKRGQRLCLICNRKTVLAAMHRWLSKPENRAKNNSARNARRAKSGR